MPNRTAPVIPLPEYRPVKSPAPVRLKRKPPAGKDRLYLRKKPGPGTVKTPFGCIAIPAGRATGILQKLVFQFHARF